MLITVLVNVLRNIDAAVYNNHIAFFVNTAKNRPSIQYDFYTPPRMSIDRARNEAAKLALVNEADYLMFIDDDVLIPRDTLIKLIDADKDVIAGQVVIRGHPFNNMAFKYTSPISLAYYNDLPLSTPCLNGHEKYDIECDSCRLTPLQELVQVGAVGFSCCLIKTSVLKKIEPPYFVTGPNHTEDIYFCCKLADHSPETSIWLHTGVECGHMLSPEPVEWRSRKKMQEFYAPYVETPYMRDTNHIKHNLARLRDAKT